MSATRRHSSGGAPQGPGKGKLDAAAAKTQEMGSTIFSGWTGELLNLQDDTLRLLQRVQPKRRNSLHQHTIGKGWAMSASSLSTTGAKPKTQKSPKRAATASSSQRGLSTRGSSRGGPMSMLLSDYHMELAPAINNVPATPLYPERGMTPMTPNPANAGFFAWSRSGTPATIEDNATAGMSRGGPRPHTAISQRSAEADVDEEPMRVLDFDYEKDRVVQAKDVFVPSKDARLLDLEREKARLEYIALRQETDSRRQERQRVEIAARKEWLRRDVAALKVQRLFRGHLGRRQCELVREMQQIELQAESEWVEVHDPDHGEKWYFNPVTGKSQWEVPPSLSGLAASDDKAKVLPSVRRQQLEKDAQAEEEAAAAKSKPNKRHSSSLMADAPPSAPQQQEDGGSLLPPLFPGGGPTVNGVNDEPGTGPVMPEEDADSAMTEKSGGLFADMDSRLFLLDGKKGVALRETVKSALKQCKWDSVSTLLTDLMIVDDGSGNISVGGGASSNASLQSTDEPELSSYVVHRKPLLPDPTGPRPMAALVKKKDLSAVVDSRGKRQQQATTTGKQASSSSSRKSPSRASAKPATASSTARVDQRPGTATLGSEGMVHTTGGLGLAIRDVTTPGFEPPSLDTSRLGSSTSRSSNNNNDKESSPRAAEGSATAKNSSGAVLIEEVCFNCWSAGRGKKCNLHNVDKDGKPLPLKGGESKLMCKNWDLGVMRRRYRAEEIQEVFAKSASSLRYDRQRKVFLTVVEQRHPLYRQLNELIAKHNLRSRAFLHARMWVKSLIEYMSQKNNSVTGDKDIGLMYRATVSIRNFFDLKRYSRAVRHLIPQPPITGTSWPERREEVQYLFEEPHPETNELVRFIFSPPTPVPRALYEPRRYTLPTPTAIELPNYKDVRVTPATKTPNVHMAEESSGAWLEVFMASMARDCVAKAKEQVKKLAPASLAARLQRKKYPPPQTLRFATFARKPTVNNMAVGGLCPEIMVNQLVQTHIPAQYGNLMVLETSAVAPDISPEITALFKSLEVPFLIAGFDKRELIHALNTRKSPTVSLLTGIKKTNRTACGLNRPEQTDEKADLGFRTSQFADGLPILITIHPWAFTPTSAVATLNRATSNPTVTSHADLNYPFCEPSSRASSTMDYYHLLLTGVCTPNKSQVFTTFGMQLPGQYLRHGDMSLPLGPIVTAVYRSWAFKQKATVEEFVTDDGVPYWYDRRTNETFWERPLMPVEQLSVKEGGTVVDGSGEAGETDKKYAGSNVVRYNNDDMRKVMLKKHESPTQMVERRKQAAYSAQLKFGENELRDLAAQQANALANEDEQQEEEAGGEDDNGMSSTSRLTLQGAEADGGKATQAGMTMGARSPSHRKSSVGGAAGEAAPNSPSKAPLPTLRKGDEAIINTISSAIVQALPLIQDAAQTPEDVLRLGMGLGIHLQSAGIIEEVKRTAAAPEPEKPVAGTGMSLVSKEWMDAHKTDGPPPKHPIGIPDADPKVAVKTASSLDHSAEEEQRERLKNSKPLSLLDQVKGLKVVATPTPDEKVEEAVLMDPIDVIKASVPVLAHPPKKKDSEFDTHRGAGIGTTFTLGEQTDMASTSKKAALRSLKDPIPPGFLAAIHERHVGKQYVDYLPNVPNLPQLNCIGAVKPRSAAEDWLAIGFDPWSAGKDPLQTEHCKYLGGEQRVDRTQYEGASGAAAMQEAFIDSVDHEGMQRQAEVQAELNKLEEDFNLIASYCRHGKYREIEECISQVDWNLPIDYTDKYGNTLLHIAVQNGSKRIAKLLLRRGADLNKQNLNGETVLHFAYAYGFDDLGDYLKSKGADDTIVNIDGLTPYEGLHQDDVIDI